MQECVTIALKDLRFHAWHGVYADEKKTGNEFELNVSISYSPISGTVTDLHDTVNYVTVYDLIKSEMQKPRELLETLVMELAEYIHAKFPYIKEIAISIDKLQAPISHFTGKVGVKYIKKF